MMNANNSAAPLIPPSDFESLFTSTDLENLPPVPFLPPHDPFQSIETSGLMSMSSRIQIHVETERLKAELFAITAQRAAEQQAYATFLNTIEPLITLLPEQAKTVPMRMALQNLFETSRRYRAITTEISNQREYARRLPPETQSSHRQHQGMINPHSTEFMTTAVAQQNPLLFNPLSSGIPVRSATSAKQQNAIYLLKQSLEKLHMAQPSPSPSLDDALDHLRNNISTFASFVVLYLNGRHRHFALNLKPEISAIVGGFFADPADAKQVIMKIMKVIKDGLRYTEHDVKRLSDDIVGPMGTVLWSLITLLEGRA